MKMSLPDECRQGRDDGRGCRSKCADRRFDDTTTRSRRSRNAMGRHALRDMAVLRPPLRLYPLFSILVLLAAGLAFCASSASAVGVAGWSIHVVPEPSSFAATDHSDRYQLLVLNAGVEASHGEVTLTDTLPPGIVTVGAPKIGEDGPDEGEGWNCTGGGQAVVTCHLSEQEGPHGVGVEGSVLPGHYAAGIDIHVSAPQAMLGNLANEVTVQGGGLAPTTATEETPIGRAAYFELNEFAFELGVAGGVSTSQAGAHPWELTTSLGIPSADAPANGNIGQLFSPQRTLKGVVVELPAGLLGDPQATEQCEESQLRAHDCPAKSEVGVYAIILDSTSGAPFSSTADPNGSECCSAVYNMVPEAGYPAEFGFTFATNVPVLMYANVVHTGTGYRVRVTVPDISEIEEPVESAITFFGEPGLLNGSGSRAAFLSSPSDCSAEREGLWSNVVSGVGGTAKGDASRVELEPWGEPGDVQTREATAYPGLTGCGALVFDPSLSFAPSPAGGEGSSVADEPSAYSVNLKVPQTSEFSELATPDLRDSTVRLPVGVSASPSSATGLVGCQSEGPEGINIGSSDIGPRGEDFGDPEATELGEGHAGPGGNASPYDDGFYHTAHGHCPEASVLGSVEVCTPLLPNRVNEKGEKVEGEQYCEEHAGVAPLTGHVYLAQPECGGAGQPECEDAYAEGKGGAPNEEGKKEGRLIGMYIEVEGSGVIAKLPGTVTANPATGQLTGTFKEAPQLAFGELKLHFKGGARAPVANPQTCGTFTTTSLLEPWSHKEANESAGTPDATPSSSFAIGGCAATMAFSPSFTAGTTSPAAGAFSPFVLSFSRQDREQDFSGLTETMPPGLVGKIAGIPLCPEAQANAGTCAPESKIGVTSALAGPGPEPFSETGGNVYLTGPYGGGPFGLSIVVPTKAGPFNLGNEVVRAAIHINPNTAQVSVTTNPLPQSKDGIPFRLRSISTEVNRAGFTLNPTSCAPQAVTATITAAQGASANVSSPFQATGCQNLPFKPTYTYTTAAKTSKADGASLVVDVEQKPGEANIAKVDLTIPKILPSRLTTIQKACLAATFEANPASCPEGSDIGTGTAYTPLLNGPLTGPAYLVSHGNAAFPDVEFVLQGEGITIILDGKTDIKKGVTYSRFETVPDSPITKFVTVLPEGPHSALTTERPGETNLCATTTTKTVTVRKKVTRRVHGKLKKVTKKTKKTITTSQKITIPTTITAQNGAVINQNTKVTVTGCHKPKPTTHKPHHQKTE
jgi:hypothetical protein